MPITAYFDIITAALSQTWRHKSLWLFGLLASTATGILTGFSGTLDDISTQSALLEELIDPGKTPVDEDTAEAVAEGATAIAETAPGLGASIAQILNTVDTPVLYAVGFALLVLGIVIFGLVVIGQGGMIGGANLGLTNGRVSLGQAWDQGVEHLERIVLVSLITNIPVMILVYIGLRWRFTTVPGIQVLLSLVPIFFILLPLVLLGYVVGFLAKIIAVTQKLGFVETFTKTWSLIRPHLRGLVNIVLVILGVQLVLNAVFAVPLFSLILTTFGNIIVGILLPDAPIPGILENLLSLVIGLPILLALQAVAQTWYWHLWITALHRLGIVASPPDSPAPQT